jgi:polar amino acid transport system substrate-binding protein
MKIYKIFIIIIFLAHPIYASSALPQDIGRLKEKKVLIIAMHADDYFPFFADVQGKMIGYDVDIAHDIAKKLGIEKVIFNRSAKTFDQVVDQVANGQADLGVSYVSQTLNRAQKILYTDSYMKLRMGYLISRTMATKYDIVGVDDIEKLNDHKVIFGGEKGNASTERTHLKFPKAKLIETLHMSKALEDLASNKTHALYNDEFIIKNFFQGSKDRGIYFKQIYSKGEYDYLGIVAPKDAYNLINWLNLYIRSRGDHYSYEQLYLHYLPILKEAQK